MDNCIRGSQDDSTKQVNKLFYVNSDTNNSIIFRGVVALEGWSLSVEDDKSRQDLSGHGYVLDTVSAMELPEYFPYTPSQHIVYVYNEVKRRVTPG